MKCEKIPQKFQTTDENLEFVERIFIFPNNTCNIFPFIWKWKILNPNIQVIKVSIPLIIVSEPLIIFCNFVHLSLYLYFYFCIYIFPNNTCKYLSFYHVYMKVKIFKSEHTNDKSFHSTYSCFWSTHHLLHKLVMYMAGNPPGKCWQLCLLYISHW